MPCSSSVGRYGFLVGNAAFLEIEVAKLARKSGLGNGRLAIEGYLDRVCSYEESGLHSGSFCGQFAEIGVCNVIILW